MGTTKKNEPKNTEQPKKIEQPKKEDSRVTIKGFRCSKETHAALKSISETIKPKVTINALLEYGAELVIKDYKEKGIIE